MTPRQADAQLGLHAAYAFDMFAGHPLALEPPPDPRLSPDWVVRGYITAQDVILKALSWLQIDAPRVCYGFLVESVASPGTFVAVIRGTANLQEWAIDAKFGMVKHPAGGYAEAGFYGVYQTMRYQPAGGGPSSPVAEGIAATVAKGKLTTVGHSLGAALDTYLTLDLATWCMGDRLRARIFASPRPGDQGFADAFAAHVSDAVAYAYARDEVPEVPKGFGYLPLHCLQLIQVQDAEAIIADTLAAAHHIYSYAAMLYYQLIDWAAVPQVDRPLTEVILGPRLAVA